MDAFIAHRPQDEAIAHAIGRTLQELSRGELKVFLSPHSRDLGREEVQYLSEMIGRASIFLYVTTQSDGLSQGWDSTSFQVGMYLGGLHDQEKPLMTVSSRISDLPNALRQFHNYEGTLTGIRKLLSDIIDFVNPDKHDFELVDVIHERANRIAEAFKYYTVETRTHTTSMVLTFSKKDFEKSADQSITEIASVQLSYDFSQLLGLQPVREQSLVDFCDLLPKEHNWIYDLQGAIRSVLSGHIPDPIKTTMVSRDGRAYAPVVYRDQLHAGTYSFEILFVPSEKGAISENLVFVITSFDPKMESVYQAIASAARDHGLEATRIKDIIGDYKITEKMIELIRKANLIVADLSLEKPNVYFELGFARGLKKTVVSIVRRNTNIHFDVKDWTYIEYEDVIELKQTLSKRFDAELHAMKKTKPQY